VVEVAADGGRGEAQEVAEFGGADGSMLQHGVEDAVTRALFSVVGLAADARGNDVGSLIRDDGHVRPGGPEARSGAAGPGSGGSGSRHSGSRRKRTHGIHNTIMS
jgi:hypothetical protein